MNEELKLWHEKIAAHLVEVTREREFWKNEARRKDELIARLTVALNEATPE
jgi:hypothetical protein